MTIHKAITTLTVGTILTAGSSVAQAPDIANQGVPQSESPYKMTSHVPRPKLPPKPVLLVPEFASTVSAGFAMPSAFAQASSTAAADTALVPPVTLSYSGNNPTLLIETRGPNKGLESLISNGGSPASAVYGQTNGSGAGTSGYNSGTTGPAAKFEVTNAKNAQPAVFANNGGLGPAVIALNTRVSQESGGATQATSAVLAQNQGGLSYGVAGIGSTAGVFGGTPDDLDDFSFGVYGQATAGTGIGAYSSSGLGARFQSDTGTGVYALSDFGWAIQAEAGGSATIVAHNSAPQGIAIIASSDMGLAAQFGGDVLITGTLTVGTTAYSSDKRLKQEVQSIDSSRVLEKIDQLPVTSWDYKTDPTRRHIGPMAQDFHAAFGLNGDDDSHISEVDIAGVSIAAIKELSIQLKTKDERISKLESQLQSLTETIAVRFAALENVHAGRTTVVARNAGIGRCPIVPE